MKPLEKVPVSTVMVAVVAVSAALFTYPKGYWFIPSFGGIVAIVGVFSGYRKLNDIGMMVTGLSFYALNHSLPFNEVNILIVLGMFFALYSTWHTGNRELLLESMKCQEEVELLKRYWRSSNIRLLMSMITAFILSVMGVYVARFSYLGIKLDPISAIPVAVIFGSLVLIAIYVLVEVLPRYVDPGNV